MRPAENRPAAGRLRHRQGRTTGASQQVLVAVCGSLRTFLPPAPFWSFADRCDPALRWVKVLVLKVAAVYLPHHRVSLANLRQDRNDGAEAEERYHERQEGHDTNGHQRRP